MPWGVAVPGSTQSRSAGGGFLGYVARPRRRALSRRAMPCQRRDPRDRPGRRVTRDNWAWRRLGRAGTVKDGSALRCGGVSGTDWDLESGGRGQGIARSSSVSVARHPINAPCRMGGCPVVRDSRGRLGRVGPPGVGSRVELLTLQTPVQSACQIWLAPGRSPVPGRGRG